MRLSLKDVEHIADLAKLELSVQEKGQFREQLSAILDYAAVLQQVDTSAIPPSATVLPLQNVMRDDVATSSLPPEDILANAPDEAEGCFRVPAILRSPGRPA